jgi:hypothetical protein
MLKEAGKNSQLLTQPGGGGDRKRDVAKSFFSRNNFCYIYRSNEEPYHKQKEDKFRLWLFGCRAPLQPHLRLPIGTNFVVDGLWKMQANTSGERGKKIEKRWERGCIHKSMAE